MLKKVLMGLSLACLVACNEKTQEKEKTENAQASAEKVSASVQDIPVDETSIFRAIASGDAALLKAAIAKGQNINATCNILDSLNSCFLDNHKNECSSDGAEVMNPIYLAMIKGNFEIAKALIEAGADVMSVSKPCVYVCEPECSYQLIEDMAMNKLFYPGYSDSATSVYTDDRIRISMLMNKDKGESMLPVDASFAAKFTEPSEDMLVEYFKFAKSKEKLEFNSYNMEFENGGPVFKTALNYAEDLKRAKLAEYLKSIGARKVLKAESYTLSEKDGETFTISTCEDVHKIFYSDGTTDLSLDECGT